MQQIILQNGPCY